jgi:hypothetical protein
MTAPSASSAAHLEMTIPTAWSTVAITLHAGSGFGRNAQTPAEQKQILLKSCVGSDTMPVAGCGSI